MILFVDPFMLFRALITLVLGGIWLYTMIEGLTLVMSMVSRSKGTDNKAAIEAKEALRDADAYSGRIPRSVVHRLRESRRNLSNERLLRVSKKAAILKFMEFFSFRTFRIVWKELFAITILLGLNGVVLFYYYSQVL